jgi:transposase
VTNVKLTLEQWKKILEFLRTRTDLYIGKPTTCKRFINAILFITRSGIQWRLLPKKYGHWNSIYKRFNRWTEQGIWAAMLEYFASDADMESVMIDATYIRAHSSAAAKGGIKQRKVWDGAKVASPVKSTLLSTHSEIH